MEFKADIDTAYEGPVDVELRVGWPVRILLETLPHSGVAEDVEATVLNIRVVGEEVDDALAEAAGCF